MIVNNDLVFLVNGKDSDGARSYNCRKEITVSVDEIIVGDSSKRRKEVFAKLKKSFVLPSPSGTVMEMIRVCNKPDSSLSDVADVIQTDPSLSAEIIKYANSAYMATGVQVASVQKAAIKLGMKNIVSIAMGLSLLAKNKSGSCEHFDYALFWRTCLARAIAARELSKMNSEFEPDELFICGLLCQMGQLALCSIFPEEYDKILVDPPILCTLREKEQTVFDIDSSELTVELFLDWGMPAHLALASGFYQELGSVELGTDVTLRTSAYLKIADIMAEMCQSKEPLLDHLDNIFSIADMYQIDVGVFSETFGRVVTAWHDSGRLFAVTTSECFTYTAD